MIHFSRNRGKAAALPALPGTAPLGWRQVCSTTSCDRVEHTPMVFLRRYLPTYIIRGTSWPTALPGLYICWCAVHRLNILCMPLSHGARTGPSSQGRLCNLPLEHKKRKLAHCLACTCAVSCACYYSFGIQRGQTRLPA